MMAIVLVAWVCLNVSIFIHLGMRLLGRDALRMYNSRT